MCGGGVRVSVCVCVWGWVWGCVWVCEWVLYVICVGCVCECGLYVVCVAWVYSECVSDYVCVWWVIGVFDIERGWLRVNACERMCAWTDVSCVGPMAIGVCVVCVFVFNIISVWYGAISTDGKWTQTDTPDAAITGVTRCISNSTETTRKTGSNTEQGTS